jgi:glycosyltransferase involved in cell wall biosynthesis
VARGLGAPAGSSMILFFVPSYNDHELVSDIAESLLEDYAEAELLVIDDGSAVPLTLSFSPSLETRVRLYRLETNAGLGIATSIAIDYFLQGSHQVLLRVDADGEHPLSEVEKLYQPVLNGATDIVWAERVIQNVSQSARARAAGATRRWAKSLTRWIAQRAMGCNHVDWFSGFFAMSRDAAQRYQADYFERYCEVQMLCLIYARHMRIQIVVVTQMRRMHGQSSIRLFSGLMVLLRAWLLILVYARARGDS